MSLRLRRLGRPGYSARNGRAGSSRLDRTVSLLAIRYGRKVPAATTSAPMYHDKGASPLRCSASPMTRLKRRFTRSIVVDCRREDTWPERASRGKARRVEYKAQQATLGEHYGEHSRYPHFVTGVCAKCYGSRSMDALSV